MAEKLQLNLFNGLIYFLFEWDIFSLHNNISVLKVLLKIFFVFCFFNIKYKFTQQFFFVFRICKNRFYDIRLILYSFREKNLCFFVFYSHIHAHTHTHTHTISLSLSLSDTNTNSFSLTQTHTLRTHSTQKPELLFI